MPILGLPDLPASISPPLLVVQPVIFYPYPALCCLSTLLFGIRIPVKDGKVAMHCFQLSYGWLPCDRCQLLYNLPMSWLWVSHCTETVHGHTCVNGNLEIVPDLYTDRDIVTNYVQAHVVLHTELWVSISTLNSVTCGGDLCLFISTCSWNLGWQWRRHTKQT
jgi:hypothetical protein